MPKAKTDPLLDPIRDALSASKAWLDTDPWKTHKDPAMRKAWMERHNTVTEALLHVDSLAKRPVTDTTRLDLLQRVFHAANGGIIGVRLPPEVPIRQMIDEIRIATDGEND